MMKKIIFYSIIFLLLVCHMGLSQNRGFRSKSTTISVEVLDTEQPDSIWLYVYDGSNTISRPDMKFGTSKNADSKYIFELGKLSRPVHFSLFTLKSSLGTPKYLLNHFLCEPGDDVTLRMSLDSELLMKGNAINYYYYAPYNHISFGSEKYKAKFQFSGKGSDKYTCRYEADRKLIYLIPQKMPMDGEGNFLNNDHCDSAKATLMRAIESYKNKISATAYQVLKVDADADMEVERIDVFKNFGAVNHRAKDSDYYRNAFNTYVDKVKNYKIDVSASAKMLSFNYANYAAQYYYYFGAGFFSAKGFSLQKLINAYDSIKVHFSGEMRDKILTQYIKLSYQNILSRSNEGLAVVEDAMSIIKTPNRLQELIEFMAAMAKNIPAYNFRLPDEKGEIVKLSDYAGKVVFIDFWYTGCHACANYYKQTVAPAEEYFESDPDVVFISISIDTDKVIWNQSLRSGIYSSAKAVNVYTEGKGYDHQVCKYYQIEGCPRPILVGKNGKVFSNSKVELNNGGLKGLKKVIENALNVNK